jgi:tRNA(fMet)-specific endonuclease VapC
LDLILDTNALSAVADGQGAAVRAFAKAVQLAVPVIVLGEFRFGIVGSRHKADYERWLSAFLSTCAVLHVDEETTLSYAAVRMELREAGTPIPSNDIWIAALCRQHAYSILSRDRHFDLVEGLKRLAW